MYGRLCISEKNTKHYKQLGAYFLEFATGSGVGVDYSAVGQPGAGDFAGTAK